MDTKGIILLVEDEKYLREPFARHLEFEGYTVFSYKNFGSAKRDIEGGLIYDVGLIDRSLDDEFDGDELINICKKINPLKPVISLSGYSSRKYTYQNPDGQLVKGSIAKNILLSAIERALNKK